MRNECLRPDHFSLKTLLKTSLKWDFFGQTHNFFLMEKIAIRDIQQFLIVKLFITDM